MLIVINLRLYFKPDRIQSFFDLDLTEDSTITGFLCFALIYSIGLLYEPVAYFIFSLLKSVYKPIIKSKRLVQLKAEKKNSYRPMVEEIIQSQYNFKEKKINYFQFARLYLTQSDKTNNYLIFLSRYGFYRNLSVLALLNLPIFLIYSISKGKFSSDPEIAIPMLIVLLFMHFILYIRALEFFNYAGNEAYRFFIMNHKLEGANSSSPKDS